MMNINGKKIGIFGLGKTGTATYRFLAKNFNCEIICYDDNQDNLPENQALNITDLNDKSWSLLDYIIPSPGISPDHKIYQIARANNVKLLSDIEIFISLNRESKIIAITGTNGKSTITALTGFILKKAGLNYHVGGNIGRAVLTLPQNQTGYILELSSFQLDLISKCDFDIGILSNITPDHLDRYGDYDNYINSKEKILKNESIKIVGTRSESSYKLLQNYRINHQKIIEAGDRTDIDNVFYRNDYIHDNYFDFTKIFLKTPKSLYGEHNSENIAISFIICRLCGMSNREIIHNIQDYCGLEHRMQYVGNYKNIHFYNDSKATNTDSACSSISSLNSIYWLAGGVFKEKDLGRIPQYFSHIKKAYLFGQSKNIIQNEIKGLVPCQICDNMEEAYEKAKKDALMDEEDIVNILLAPACASFDQYDNFERRGEDFINLCKK